MARRSSNAIAVRYSIIVQYNILSPDYVVIGRII